MKPPLRIPCRWPETRALLAVAAAAGGAGAMLAPSWPGPGAALLLAAAGLALAAARPPSAAPSQRPLPAPRPTSGTPRPSIPFVAGLLLCLASGWWVWNREPRTPAHAAWFAGLALLLGAAGEGRGRQPASSCTETRRTWAAALLLGGAVLALYLWRLDTIPFEIHGDDAEVGNDALRLLREPLDLFRTSWFRLPILHAAPTAPFVAWLGTTAAALRLPTALFGAATTALVFLTGRRLGSAATGLLAAILLATNPFFFHLSRTGFHYVHASLVSILCFWLFLRGWQDRCPGAWIAGGVVLGLGLQTYYAVRIVPLLLAATWGWAWLVRPDGARLARAAAFACLVATSAAVAAPIAAHFALHLDDLWYRVQGVSLFAERGFAHASAGYGTSSLPAIVLRQLARALGLFHAVPDTSLQYGGSVPLLDPLSGAAFILGIGTLLGRPRDPLRFMVPVWILAPLIAGVALTVDAPFYPRASGTLPFVALAAAVGLAAGASALLPRNARAWPAGAAATLLAIAAGAGNLQWYLCEYAPSHRLSPARPVGEWAARFARDRTLVLVDTAHRLYVRHGTIRYLAAGIPAADAPDIDALARRARDPSRTAFAVLPPVEGALSRLRDGLGPLRVWRHVDASGSLIFAGVLPAPELASDQVQTVRSGPPPPPPGARRLLQVLRQAALAGSLLAVIAGRMRRRWRP